MSALQDITMRAACKHCDCVSGRIETRSGQDCVFCGNCGRWQYNAPKTETGRKERTVSTTHRAIKPAQRRRILDRAHRCCEVCHSSGVTLHVGHILSVKDGVAYGLTDAEINSDENLIAECEQCNLGQGSRPMSIRFYIALLKKRMERQHATN